MHVRACTQLRYTPSFLSRKPWHHVETWQAASTSLILRRKSLHSTRVQSVTISRSSSVSMPRKSTPVTYVRNANH